MRLPKRYRIDADYVYVKKLSDVIMPIPKDKVWKIFRDSFEYGIIRNQLDIDGKIIGNMDILIGAQAISNELILITNKTKEFKRIRAIKLENWILRN